MNTRSMKSLRLVQDADEHAGEMGAELAVVGPLLLLLAVSSMYFIWGRLHAIGAPSTDECLAMLVALASGRLLWLEARASSTHAAANAPRLAHASRGNGS